MMQRWVKARPFRTLLLLTMVASVIVAVVLTAAVDTTELGAGLSRGFRDPLGLGLITIALLAAFAMRAQAWCRLLPELSFGQSLAGVHLALGGNHILPFRMGEPLRVASVVRRTDIDIARATSTTVVLRAADVVTLVLLGAVAAPAFLSDALNPAAVAILTCIGVAGVAAVLLLVKQRAMASSETSQVRLPDLPVLALVVSAWLAEALVVWQVVRWFEIDLGPREALAVLAAAVTVQIFAITPGGIGTYEAAGTAALVASGVSASTAITAVIALHGVKTLYSLVAGGVAVLKPEPSMLGRLRLVSSGESVPTAVAPDTSRIVFFLPAYNEAPRIRDVLLAAPTHVDGHSVELVVVDDGSTDDTAAVARAAGATVIEHITNRGLGAAVQTGFTYAVLQQASAAAFCDADGEYAPGELERLVRPVLAGDTHYVVGTRFGGDIQRMLPHRRLGNLVLTRWTRFVTRAQVTDGQSGYRALSAAALADVDIPHDYNYAQVLTVELIAKGYGYHEVPISYAFRSSGRSFVRLGRYLRHVVPAVWRQLNQDDLRSFQPKKERVKTC